ncbi:MAG: rod shape-determining protein MreC [Proteobacteria bacterium]|nr:rod shape-determining protein MreC [Pseudomonadota bacterium]
MWSPNDSSFSQNHVLRFLLLEIICIVLMVLDYSAKIATPIRAAVSTLTYPLIKVIELPQNAYEFLSSSVSNQQQLLDQNIALKQQLSQAQIDLLQLEVISQQNIELRQLLQAKQLLPLKTTAAFLININTGNNDHHFILNQGYNQGVTVGQTVLDLNGVAGQVYLVDLETAHVILITNENHALPVEFLRTGIRTFAYGTGDLHSLNLPEIPQSANIKTGDILITSGYGGVFPRGLKIGVIKSIKESTDRSFKQAEAEPSANLDLLKQVLLVWSDGSKNESGIKQKEQKEQKEQTQ